MEKKKSCFKCGKEIKPNDKFVSLITTEKKKIIEQVDFHLIPNCWGDYNTARVHEQILHYSKVGEHLLQSIGVNI